jgi:hypothetical protein
MDDSAATLPDGTSRPANGINRYPDGVVGLHEETLQGLDRLPPGPQDDVGLVDEWMINTELTEDGIKDLVGEATQHWQAFRVLKTRFGAFQGDSRRSVGEKKIGIIKYLDITVGMLGTLVDLIGNNQSRALVTAEQCPTSGLPTQRSDGHAASYIAAAAVFGLVNEAFCRIKKDATEAKLNVQKIEAKMTQTTRDFGAKLRRLRFLKEKLEESLAADKELLAIKKSSTPMATLAGMEKKGMKKYTEQMKSVLRKRADRGLDHQKLEEEIAKLEEAIQRTELLVKEAEEVVAQATDMAAELEQQVKLYQGLVRDTNEFQTMATDVLKETQTINVPDISQQEIAMKQAVQNIVDRLVTFEDVHIENVCRPLQRYVTGRIHLQALPLLQLRGAPSS